MKIMVIADEESKLYWDFFKKEYFEGIDLIISCGDLASSYLSFLVTMVNVPVLYVRGNHDDRYSELPPEGCICIEDDIYTFEGVRIMGLGGCMRYNHGKNQYTEKQMKSRANRLAFKAWRTGGIDILVTHAPARGINDSEDLCHRGFETFNMLLDKYHPKYFVHGHVHITYNYRQPRETLVGDTMVINAFEKYVIDI